MKKLLFLLLVSALVLSLFIFPGCAPKEVTVSLLVQEVGPNSPPHTTWITNVVNLAVEEWNSNSANKVKIKLNRVEHPTTPEGTKSVFETIINDKKTVAIIGSPYSGVVLNLNDDIKNAGIPYITAATGDKITQNDNDSIFRIVTPDISACRISIKYVVKVLGKTKLAVLYTDNPYGQGANEATAQVATEMGATVVKSLPYKPAGNNVDVREQLKELMKTDAEFLLVWPDPGEGNPIALQMDELKYTTPFIIRNGFLKLDTENPFTPIHNESYLSLSFFRTDENQDYVSKVESKFGKEYAHFIPASYYDGSNILFNAIAAVKGNITPEAINKQLREITYNGALGEYQFDENGNSLKSAFIVQIKDTKVELVKIEVED